MKHLIIWLIILINNSISAQVTMYEQEPNDEHTTVNQISAPIIILGDMQNTDQDMFLWEISDVDAGYLWDIELDGMPERLTKIDVMQLTFTEDGTGVTKVNKLFSIKNNGGISPVTKKGLLFNPGNYYLGLSYAGGNSSSKPSLIGDGMLNSLGEEYVTENQKIDGMRIDDQSGYQISISKGAKLNTISVKNNSKENPVLLRINAVNSLYFETDKRWMYFKITEKDTYKTWKINGNINLGNSIKVDLYNTQGEKITSTHSNATGQFSLPDLKLPIGDYVLGLTSKINALSSIELLSTGAYIEGNETEPNDGFSTANVFTIENSISARMGKDLEKDYFKFQVSEENSVNQFDIKLTNHDQSSFNFCLYGNKNKTMQCKINKGDINLSQLNLKPGEYGLSVSRGKIDSKYTIDVINQGPKKSIMEAEPNDSIDFATSMNQKRIVKGNFNGKDSDYFYFEVDEKPQFWTIQAIGENLTYIALYNSANKRVQSSSDSKGSKRIRISNLALQPGKHIIQLKGTKSQYILRAFATGPYDGTFESEPNNELINTKMLNLNQPKKGLLQDKTDVDMYRFNLKNEQGISLEVQPAKDADIYFKLYWESLQLGRKTSKLGEKVTYTGTLPAGDYSFSIQSSKSSSTEPYQIVVKSVNLMDCQTDCEPNDSAYQASLIHPAINLSGESGTHEDYDWHKLPAFANETTVTFKSNINKIGNELSGFIDFEKKIYPNFDAETEQLSFTIPANEASYYRVLKNIKYDYDIFINSKKIQAPKQYDGINLSLENIPNKVQAFSQYAQNIQAQLIVENTGDQDQIVNVELSANNHRWIMDINQETDEFILKTNEKITVPINVYVPNELARNQTVRLNFVINNKQGFLSNTWQDIRVETGVPLIEPSLYWSIDKELLGGINVAASVMGSIRTADDLIYNDKTNGSGFDQLFDGIAGDGLGMQYRGGRKSDQDFITIDLAGEDIINVQGLLLNPLSKGKPNVYLKDFDLHLSTDGINFKSVLKDTVKAINSEQSFVLEKITPAKFARLYFLNSYDLHKKPPTVLGEWKVIASPLQPLNPKTGFNIADPKFGGHVAWSKPETSKSWDQNLLNEVAENKHIRSSSNKEWQWVIGFHDQRAAKIDKIQWQHPEFKSKKVKPINQVKVLVSLDSNVGPWTMVAEKEFVNLQSMDDIVFERPVWARYVKFSIDGIKQSESTYLPNTIRIFEHPNDDNYRSILGEWGNLSVNAYYEMQHYSKINNDYSDTNNHSKQSAIDLTVKQKASGQVQLEHTDKHDWYKFKTKQGNNTLKINLSGKLTVETIIKIEDDQGNTIPLVVYKKQNNNIEYHIPVEANKEYYIKVEEPPRSVMFVWDTSGSTAAYHPMIYNAISSYSNDVIEGRDTVNFLPFGGKVLMKEWYGKPYYLKTIINNYRRLDVSSNAEKFLHHAARALENRQGSKSVIIITDAITGKFEEVWDALKVSQPRVFSIGIIRNGFGGNSHRQIDLMQSWSRVNNGDFQQVVNANQVEYAFDRAAVKLRQPADYTLNVSSDYIKAPGPGKLSISQDDSKNSGAVELILDASGSMLKRLDGKRRINIAKEVLIKAVTETIPEGTPLALRVFGDKQANACRTDLAIKLNPLDRNKAKSIISNINAKNLAKTPIADSLAKVANDLKSHKGKKIVILVTDGEETCEGNPEEVIAKLVEQGLDIRLNIVGFAIDDEDLKAEFNQWSIQGGGKYFDSNNPESLKASISDALKTPFSVFSLSGEMVSEGVVNGEPLELPAGHYNIKVYDSDVKSFESYHIKGDVGQEIEL